jgi:hypothetical protein
MARWRTAVLGVLSLGLIGLLQPHPSLGDTPRWVKLFDGSNLDHWNLLGEANWKIVDGAVVADKGAGGFLVSKNIYKDFHVKADFWISDEANSGIFIRWLNLGLVNTDNFYEINMFDKRPDPTYATGSIVNIGKSNVKSAGKWNTIEVIAKGSRLQVVLNGEKTVDAEDSKLALGFIALQYGGGGTVKFRNVQIEQF